MSQDRNDDFDRGLVNRRAVLGDAWVEKSTAGANAFNAEFQDFITRFAWNDIWGRPGLDHPTRRLLVLGMTMGLARWEEFELHCGAAIRASRDPASGVTLQQIQETLMQGAIYCGVPAANTAFKLFVELLRKEGIPVDPAPLTRRDRVASHHTFSAPQLHVALQGQGGAKVPVVLSHALGLDIHMWDALAAELAAAGHPVLRYEHRGHKPSAMPPGPYTMDDLVDDAARLIREWGVGPVAWIGLSLGGMVGQGLGIRHGELLQKLVLANTTSQYPAAAAPVWAGRIASVESGGMATVADGVVERYLNPAYREAHPAEAATLRDKLLSADPVGYVACCHAVAKVDWLDRLHEIRTPTLVLAGRLDAGATPAMAEAIHERIAGAKLVVMEQASHLSVKEQPQQFAALVREFLG